MVRINQRLSKNDILWSGGRKDNNLGNVVRCEGIATTDDDVRSDMIK